MSRFLLTVVLAAVASVVTGTKPPTGPGSDPADIVFHNGSIYTVQPSFRKVSAIAVKDGIIRWLGGSCSLNRYIGSKTKVVDLNGHMMMPGLVDAHMHVLEGGKFLLTCNLNYQTLTKEEVFAHVQGCLDSDGLGPDDWMEVVNLDFPGMVGKSGLVTKIDLDEGLNTTRPVFLRSSDYHTVWANSRALQVSNVTSETPSPPNGVIERFPNGEPSGLLQDDARNLMAVPPASMEQQIENAKAAFKLLREEGITTFQDAVAFETTHEIYSALKSQGELTARVYADYLIDSPASIDEVKPIVDATVSKLKSMNDPSPISPKPTIKWQAIKGFVDGVITYPALTAALVDDYLLPRPNDNGTNADPYWPPAILARTLEELFLAGIDAQLHTDGDMAVKVALDAAQAFRTKYPSQKDTFKLGLAHDEVTQESDWARFAQLNVDAIMSFQWAQLSSFYIPDTFNALGPQRHDKLQCHPQIEAAGRPVVYGSDWPIDPLDEFLALKVGVTRSGDPLNPNSPAFQDPVFEGTFPSRKEGGLTREQAIKSITINSAKFLRADDKIGSLARGKIADMIILENNFFEVPDEELGRNRVLVTVVGGEVVYVADDAEKFLGFPEDGLPAKFPNHVGGELAKRNTIGGFAGKGLGLEEKMKVKKLRHRGACAHGHAHHKH